MGKRYLVFVCLLCCSFCFGQKKLTLIGDIQFRPSQQLLTPEELGFPYSNFIKRYRLEYYIQGTKSRQTVRLIPKEKYYPEIVKMVQVQVEIPHATLPEYGKLTLVFRFIRISDGSEVYEPASIDVGRHPIIPSDSINSSTFKLSQPIQIGAPAEVAVTTMVDFLKDKLSNDDEELGYGRTTTNIDSGKAGGGSFDDVKEYYKLITFLEPYLQYNSFFNREARELCDTLVDIKHRLLNGDLNDSVRLALANRFKFGQEAYTDYAKMYFRIKNYYLKARYIVSRRFPLWLELGLNFSGRGGSAVDRFYTGFFSIPIFGIQPISIICPYHLSTP